MIKPIVKRGDARLLVPSLEVTDFELARELITNMWDTLTVIQGLYNFRRGSGLAAIQIGERKSGSRWSVSGNRSEQSVVG